MSDVTLNSPPTTGIYTTPAPHWAIEGVLSYEFPRLFSSIYSNIPYVISAKSVVISEANGTACVLALNARIQGAVSVTGSATVTVDGCWVATNSDATDATDFIGANGALTADCVRAVGTVDDGATSIRRGIETTQLTTDCDAPLEYAPQLEDPYANRRPPSHEGTCPSPAVPVDGVTLHCSDFRPTGSLTGIHIFRNGAKLKIAANDTVTSGPEGVTFFFEGTSKVDITGTPALNLSAPTAADHPTAGLLFWAAAGNTQPMKIAGNSSSRFTGAIYNPTGKIEWIGNGAEQGCVQLVGDTITFSGNATSSIRCPSGPPGGATEIPTVTKVTLVE